MVDDRFSGDWADILFGEFHSFWVIVDRDDLSGGIGMSNSSIYQADWATPAEPSVLKSRCRSQDSHRLVGAKIDSFANLHPDLGVSNDTLLADAMLTARGWMEPDSSQEMCSGMCGAISAGRAKYLLSTLADSLAHLISEPTEPGAPQYRMSWIQLPYQ